MERVSSKVLMFGEYSVLHNSMALTIPFAKFSGKLSYPHMEGDAIAEKSNRGLREFCHHILENHTDTQFKLNVQKLSTELDKGLFFESNIPQGFGLGSSGALVAAIFLRYLDKAGDFKDELKSLTRERIQHLKGCLGGMEGYFHGTSSGIDPLSIIINEPLLLDANKEIIKVKTPTFNPEGKNVIFLLNTGMARNTDNLVGRFISACENPIFKNRLEKELINDTNAAIRSFLDKDTDAMYQHVNKLAKFQLDEMNYLIPDKYHNVVKSGMENGDYFLKLCGSGGGGYILGFTENWDTTQSKLINEDLEILYRF